MWYRRLSWNIFVPLLVVICLPLVLISLYSARSFESLYFREMQENLYARAVLISHAMMPFSPLSEYRVQVDSLCKVFGSKIATRITVVLPDGTVVGDSHSDPETMENHANRPEILDALSKEFATSRRHSATMREDMLYLALPINPGSHIAGTVRVSLSVMSILQTRNSFYGRISLWASLMILAAAGMSYLLTLRISKSVNELRIGASRFASGDLDHKLAIPPTLEIAELTRALNAMALQLHERITTITRQRNEQQAILSSMTEGVLAIDKKEHIILLNSAATRILSIDSGDVRGRWAHEVIRNTDMRSFLKGALSSSGCSEEAIEIQGPEGLRYIQLRATVLRDTNNDCIGALVVFSDFTRLRELENVRKDFVANVSHELRTPLTAVKGFVETLQAESSKEDLQTQRFLEIISSKVDRLCSIVEDLLSLSRIEQDTERKDIKLERTVLSDVLDAAISSCSAKAKSNRIAVRLVCDPALTVNIDSALFEQAIVNLLDNAINYSDRGKEVVIEAREHSGEISVLVKDQGIGIPAEHHGRIFERFYRVDKARSRKLGGTGLGLSIVKNIVLAHGGHVSVESAPGKGSCFGIHLKANV